MAAGVRDNVVTMLKVSTTDTPKNVLVTIADANGGIRIAFLIPGADFTSFNTTVNGGAAGTSLSKTYTAATAQLSDYPTGYMGEL